VRELNGWAPKTVTLDADGRVLSVTVTQSRFTPRERALLLASRREANAPRGRHGLLMSEATDAKNQFAYTARGPITDWAQKRLDDFEDAYKKKHPTADMGSLHFWVEKN
jgi:hypothetical protein